jgi:pepF/M3 family oligoendopeptidase
MASLPETGGMWRMAQPLEQMEQTWDLESIFPGGSDSEAFRAFLDRLKEDVRAFAETVERLKDAPAENIVPAAEAMADVSARLREAESFVACLGAQDMFDERVPVLTGQVKTLRASYDTALAYFYRRLADIPDEAWDALLDAHESLRAVRFPLEERRAEAREMLPPEQEAIVQELAVDGYHGWSEMYDTIVSHIKIRHDGEELSVGQAANRLHHPDRAVRRQLFGEWERAWTEQEDLCAAVLNRIGGFRLSVYARRGWPSVLKEPLKLNRMTERTLDAMWAAVEEAKPVFADYLRRKAELLGLEKLSWEDVEAPLAEDRQSIGYDEAAAFVVEQFAEFSPHLAEFAQRALRERWVEAEDRPGKRPGGFCTSFPVSGQTRIFMTYSGTSSNIATLAHELGHAYHDYVMIDLPEPAKQYAMNVAETASTFAEWILTDAMVRKAEDDGRKLVLLDEKVQNAVAFCMNIHARFRFEVQFYEERRKGMVTPERLNELMLEAQRAAYLDALDGYHPHFWASKLHFYLTDVPFYNFPYTFGYLFSAGLYARAQAEGAAFERKFVELLRDTGSMTVEQLGAKYLDTDLSRPDFWREAVAVAVRDARQFLELSRSR